MQQSAAGSNPSSPPGQFSPVTPTSNLIGSQINLTPNAQTSATGNALSNLAGNLSDPNAYQQAALGSFNTFAQQTDPAYQAAMRQATAQAAANGGIGSGALSTTYGNLANQRNLQLEGMQQQAQQAALTGQAQYQLQQLGALQGLNSQQFGQQQAQTNQLNQQQGFQNNLQQQGIGNAVNQTELQAQLQNQNFNQNYNLANLGFSQNPASASSTLANQYGQVAGGINSGLQQQAYGQAVNSALNGLSNGAQALYNYAGQPVNQQPGTAMGNIMNSIQTGAQTPIAPMIDPSQMGNPGSSIGSFYLPGSN